jgi:polyhydroxybutyrate depolymerase
MENAPTMWIALALLTLLLILGGLAVYLLHAPTRPVPLAGGTLAHRQVPVGALPRHYDTYVPGDLVPDSPLVIVLHGTRQGPAAMRALVGQALEKQARICGFAVAYAAAEKGHWNDEYLHSASPGVDDVAYVDALIEAIIVEHAIDRSRVYVLGYSSGGQLAYHLALEVPQWLAGIAVVAASLPKVLPFERPVPALYVPVLIVNGTADRFNRFAGGKPWLPGVACREPVRSSLATAEYFAALCGAEREQSELGSELEAPRLAPIRSTWSNAQGPMVMLYAVNGGGHVLHQPHGRQPRYLGAMNPAFDVPAQACEFWRL